MIATQVRKPYKQDNIWNYPELPEGMRQAQIKDFSILTDELVFGINILFKPNGLKDYQAHNILNAQKLTQWIPDIKAGTVYIGKLPYKQNGLWYYPSYPLCCRVAVFTDFLTVNNDIIPDIDFLILGSCSPEYEAHRTKTIESLIPRLDFIQVGRVFIKSK